MNLYLIGYRGSGKTTVAVHLARRLQWDLLDSDDQIEAVTGSTIREIFERRGESGFREVETEVLRDLVGLKNTVISLGGGAVLADRNRRLIASSGQTVWLQVTAETSFQRIQGDARSDSQRPNLTQPGGIEEIRQMLAERSPIYQSCADLVVVSDGKTAEAVADEVMQKLGPDWFAQ